MSSSFWRFLSAAALPLCLIVLPHLSRATYADETVLPAFKPEEHAAYDVDPPDGQAAAIRFTGGITDSDGNTIARCRGDKSGFDFIRVVPDTPYFAAVITAEINQKKFDLPDEARDYFAIADCSISERTVQLNPRLEVGAGRVEGLPALPFVAYARSMRFDDNGEHAVVHVVLQPGRMTEVVFSNEHIVRRGDVVTAGSTGTTAKQLQTVPAPPPELKWK